MPRRGPLLEDRMLTAVVLWVAEVLKIPPKQALARVLVIARTQLDEDAD